MAQGHWHGMHTVQDKAAEEPRHENLEVKKIEAGVETERQVVKPEPECSRAHTANFEAQIFE